MLSLDQSCHPLKPVSGCRLKHLGRPEVHICCLPGCEYRATALCNGASTATFKLLPKPVGLPIDLAACQILLKMSQLKTEIVT